MTSWPPELTPLPAGFNGQTDVEGLHALLHSQDHGALAVILAQLGVGANGLGPRGSASSLVERLRLSDAEVVSLRAQVAEVYTVLSQAAAGSNGDLLNRLNTLRSDLTAVDTALAGRLTTVEGRVKTLADALGDVPTLLGGYGTLGARLAAADPAPAIYASWDGTGTLLNASPVRLHAMPVADPGYPFRLQVSGQLRIGAEDETTGSEWNANLYAANSDGSGRYFIGVVAQPTIDARVKLLRFDFPVQDVVHRQAARVEVEAIRARGTGRGEHNPGNRELRVARWRA